tara:strand:- start:310 stop:447 length:138 start_codon:yes stop_codon:yes gene_type:complete
LNPNFRDLNNGTRNRPLSNLNKKEKNENVTESDDHFSELVAEAEQ